jgi:hypothetical protein
MIPDSHVMIIATFQFTAQGYPVLYELGLMPVTGRWLPFDHINDATLIDAMCDAKRSFIKSLRYNMGHDAPLAAMMTTDRDQAVLMFIEHGVSHTQSEGATHATRALGRFSRAVERDAAATILYVTVEQCDRKRPFIAWQSRRNINGLSRRGCGRVPTIGNLQREP